MSKPSQNYFYNGKNILKKFNDEYDVVFADGDFVQLDKDKRYKLDEVGFLYANFNYPDDWYYLIYYNPPKKSRKIGVEPIYEDILKYIDDSTKQLIESKTIELKKV